MATVIRPDRIGPVSSSGLLDQYPDAGPVNSGHRAACRLGHSPQTVINLTAVN
jgi:hypothetical protein